MTTTHENAQKLFPCHWDSKTIVLIDATNLFYTLKGLHKRLDFAKFKTLLQNECDLTHIYWYTATGNRATDDQPLVKLWDWLSYNGFILRTKETKEYTNEAGETKVKGNMDIEIAVDMMRFAEHCETIILFSGDNDFRYAVEHTQNKGVKVIVCSSLVTQPPIMGQDLRKQCDEFVDLVALLPYCKQEARPQGHPVLTPANPVPHYDEIQSAIIDDAQRIIRETTGIDKIGDIL